MDQLLVALDVDSSDRAFELTDQLRDVAGGFKIGSQLFCTEGTKLVRDLASSGHRIFLDLKYHDIPTTVAAAVRAASELGVWMLTVHASGGHDMLVAAKEAEARVKDGPKIVAVTVLTSFDDNNLHDLGISRSVRQQVESLAQIAKSAEIDGVVASPLEIELIKKVCGDEFIVVTPGIRNPTVDILNDQKRTMDAAAAIQAGASYLVVGRPITAAADPLAAALDITQQISKHG